MHRLGSESVASQTLQPVGHAHPPSRQTAFDATADEHCVPHAPQFMGSLVRSEHVSEAVHAVGWAGGQPHVPAVQVP